MQDVTYYPALCMSYFFPFTYDYFFPLFYIFFIRFTISVLNLPSRTLKRKGFLTMTSATMIVIQLIRMITMVATAIFPMTIMMTTLMMMTTQMKMAVWRGHWTRKMKT